jgi:decaprenylphospho-beta-D-ribofuranose 2-oxidase
MQVSNWGKYPSIEAEERSFTTHDQLRDLLKIQPERIARGLGRSYGDSSLHSFIVSSLKFNRFLSFDADTGLLHCEAGVSLDDILKVFVPRGWFLPVTPGTKYVTLGGAIASDVHGKNHHVAASISSYIHSMRIMLEDGELFTCSMQENPDLFWATCGGMGLTGVIVDAVLQLIPVESSYIKQETLPVKNIHEIMNVFEQSLAWTYSVAWIDCLSKGESLGRSVMIRGEHALLSDLSYDKQRSKPLAVHGDPKLSVPFNFPGFALNSLSIKAFNALYYKKFGKGVKRNVVHYNPFFYPLDAVNNWNRIYGKRGFTQYQFVLPKESSREGMPAILARIAEEGLGSFLAVLKLFGEQEGLLSFPQEGYTLALDFPISKKLLIFLQTLDDMVLYYGGRLYLTKDARMAEETLRAGYPALGEFQAIRTRFNTNNTFASLQSKRLGL